MKEASRGTAAVACLPTKDDLSAGYFELRSRIDQIVTQAEQQGSLQVALSGLNSIRQTLDSLSRLSGFDRQGSQVNVAVQTNVNLDLSKIAERVILKFDHEPGGIPAGTAWCVDHRIDARQVGKTTTAATADVPGMFAPAYLEQERRQLGEHNFNREYLGIPIGATASPFGWDLYERAT